MLPFAPRHYVAQDFCQLVALVAQVVDPGVQGLQVEEEPYAIEDWRADAASGRLVESFACGTAAVVTPIGRVAGPDYEFTIGSGGTGQLTAHFLERLSAIQRGRVEDSHGWLHRIG